MPHIPPRPRILAVDDEDFNLDILDELLSDAGYEVLTARDGMEAMEVLGREDGIDVIVLDRMMPRLDGMDCLRRIKADPRLVSIPVIMQTAAASRDQVTQGIEAGVFYYLTKPYDEQILLSLVRAADDDARARQSLRVELRSRKQVLGLVQSLRFRFRTLEDARAVALYVADCFPQPERAVYGLCELTVNAVEHGNLGITYAEKTQLVLSGGWQAEVERRLALPETAHRFAEISLIADADAIVVTISDTGAGFDFSTFLELSPERATDPHGRGIATARLMSFDELAYTDGGRTVTGRVIVDPSSKTR